MTPELNIRFLVPDDQNIVLVLNDRDGDFVRVLGDPVSESDRSIWSFDITDVQSDILFGGNISFELRSGLNRAITALDAVQASVTIPIYRADSTTPQTVLQVTDGEGGTIILVEPLGSTDNATGFINRANTYTPGSGVRHINATPATNPGSSTANSRYLVTLTVLPGDTLYDGPDGNNLVVTLNDNSLIAGNPLGEEIIAEFSGGAEAITATEASDPSNGTIEDKGILFNALSRIIDGEC